MLERIEEIRGEGAAAINSGAMPRACRRAVPRCGCSMRCCVRVWRSMRCWSATDGATPVAPPPPPAAIAAPRTATRVGNAPVAVVERGRISALGGVTSLIWLVVLIFMVWH